LSEKLHLETGLALILHAILAGSFAAAETIPDLAYTFGKYGHREQDSPIDLLKTRRFMRPLVKGFRHQQFRKH
jgi:hypothetical protein